MSKLNSKGKKNANHSHSGKNKRPDELALMEMDSDRHYSKNKPKDEDTIRFIYIYIYLERVLLNVYLCIHQAINPTEVTVIGSLEITATKGAFGWSTMMRSGTLPKKI